jgi:signal transduction histidine kinase
MLKKVSNNPFGFLDELFQKHMERFFILFTLLVPIIIFVSIEFQSRMHLRQSIKEISPELNQSIISGDAYLGTRVLTSVAKALQLKKAQIIVSNRVFAEVGNEDYSSFGFLYWSVDEDLFANWGEKIGSVQVQTVLFPLQRITSLVFILFSILILVFFRLRSRSLKQNIFPIISEIHELTEELDLISSGQKMNSSLLKESYSTKTASNLSNSINHFVKLTSDLNEVSFELKKNIFVIELAQQVSHDIRSPLSAMNLILSDCKEFPENKRSILQLSLKRINDIANSLLDKGCNPDEKGTEQEVDISSLIRSIVSEKQIQYQDKKDLIIEEDLRESDGKLVRMQSSEFSRVLSNLINNSIEALYQENGKVRISTNSLNNWIQISITDNGRGIPESIIEKLGQRGFSFGKEDSSNSGSGLGVYHAKKYIESIGGKFEIQSQVSIGTNIIISLPSYKE